MVTRIPFEQAPRLFWHDPIIFLIHLYSPGLSCLFSVPARSRPFLQVVLISYTGEWFENQDMNSTQCYWRDIVSQQTELIILCRFLSLSLSSSLFLLWFRVIQSKIEMSLKLTFVSFKSKMIFSPIMKQSPKLPVFFFFFLILPTSETLCYQNLLNPRELLSLLHIVKALIYKDIFSVFSHLRLTFFWRWFYSMSFLSPTQLPHTTLAICKGLQQELKN